MAEIDPILRAASEGDGEAAASLVSLLYDELRELARREMGNERKNHTLQPTALVNEVYLRLTGGRDLTFADRESFFAAAANAIRRVLVDHARRRLREKRGGGRVPQPLDGVDVAAPFEPLDDSELIALDEALDRLGAMDTLKRRIVELRFFAGFSIEELVRATGVSESTIRREWRLAKAWLRTALESGRGS